MHIGTTPGHLPAPEGDHESKQSASDASRADSAASDLGEALLLERPLEDAGSPTRVQQHQHTLQAVRQIREGLKPLSPSLSGVPDPIRSPLFASSIVKAVHERNVRLVQKQLATTPLIHQFKPLAASQNPVTRVKGTFFISQKSIASSAKPFLKLSDAKDGIKAILIKHFRKYARNVSTPVSRGQHPSAAQIYIIFDTFFNVAKPASTPPSGFHKKDLSLDTIGDETLKVLDESVEDLIDMGLDEAAQAVKLLRAEIADLYVKPDITHVPLLFNKEQLLSSLQTYQAYSTDLAEKGTDATLVQQLITQMQATVRSREGDYIPKTVVTDLIHAHIPEHRAIAEYLIKQESFYSSSDLLASNGYRDSVVHYLDSIPQPSKTGQLVDLGFKIGVENARELLAGEINLLTGSNPYLTPKTEDRFASSQLGKHEAPRGVTSLWLKEGSSLDKKLVGDYCESRKEIKRLQFLGQDVPTATQAKLEEQEAHLREAVSSRSVMAHALQDIELMAYDSHLGQYALVDGDAHCFDFARHLSPATCFTRESAAGLETLVTLRSTFIDFPQSSDPLPPDLVQSIRQRDMEKIEVALKASGRVGSRESFEKMKLTTGNLLKDAASFNDAHRLQNIEIMRTLATSYAIPFDETDIEGNRSAFISHLSQLQMHIKETCFRQIHPDALDAWKTRVSRMQAYVNSSPEPHTVAGMKEHVYSELKPFFDVLSRMSGNPSGDIGVNRFQGVLGLTSLELIISKAEKEGLATRDEIASMQTQLTSLQAVACDKLDLGLTMDL